MTNVANVGENSGDPGEHRVTTALQFLDIPVYFSMSCMDLHNPAAITRHIGLSFEVQSQMIGQYNWWYWDLFSRVKDAWRAKMSWHQQTLTIALYRKSGRHRSVAATEILSRVLQNEGCVIIEPGHLCDYWWRWRGCARRGYLCRECTSIVDARKAALYAQVGAMWREA